MNSKDTLDQLEFQVSQKEPFAGYSMKVEFSFQDKSNDQPALILKDFRP